MLAILHQVHRHGFNNFKEILAKFFRFLQSFVLIGHNHFNLSSGFQAHCDNMRKSTKKKKILRVLYLGYLVSQQERIIIWLGELLCLYLHCTCRIMKQTEGCDETKMISEGEDDGFRGRGREREGKIHLNAVMVCLLNPYSGWMGLTAPQLTSTCINHRLNWISANLPSRWLLTSSNSGRTNT